MLIILLPNEQPIKRKMTFPTAFILSLYRMFKELSW